MVSVDLTSGTVSVCSLPIPRGVARNLEGGFQAAAREARGRLCLINYS